MKASARQKAKEAEQKGDDVTMDTVSLLPTSSDNVLEADRT